MAWNPPNARVRPLAAAVAAVVLLWVSSSGARKIGTLAHKVMDPITAALDQDGIDVIPSWRDGAGVTRTTLGVLDGYPTEVAVATQTWMSGFVDPDIRYLGAARVAGGRPAPAGGTPDYAAFDHAWQKAQPGTRVFVSFTSADMPEASKVAAALSTEGYQPFLFLQDAAHGPHLTLDQVRVRFDEADHRLVLDTPRARASEGVWLESILSRPRGGLANRGRAEQVRFGKARARLGKALGDDAQAARIARQAPDVSSLDLVADTVSKDAAAKAQWLRVNELGARFTFDASAALTRENFLDPAAALRRPLETANLGVQSRLFEAASRHQVEHGSAFMDSQRPIEFISERNLPDSQRGAFERAGPDATLDALTAASGAELRTTFEALKSNAPAAAEAEGALARFLRKYAPTVEEVVKRDGLALLRRR